MKKFFSAVLLSLIVFSSFTPTLAFAATTSSTKISSANMLDASGNGFVDSILIKFSGKSVKMSTLHANGDQFTLTSCSDGVDYTITAAAKAGTRGASKRQIILTLTEKITPDASVFCTLTILPAGNLKDNSNKTISTSKITLPIVSDAVAPVIAAHADVLAEATGTLTTVTFTAPITTDNVDPDGIATCSLISPQDFSLGGTAITCNASDAAGNMAVSTTFNVIVSDTTAPVITLNGSDITLTAGDPYTDAGATALDNVDGDITDRIVTTGLPVDTSVVGTTVVRYNVTDSSGNAAVEATRTITIGVAPVKPATPLLTADDVANTVSGMETGMEYDLDGAGYVPYDIGTFSSLDFSGNHTLYVRVAAEGINPASDIVTITFATNPVTPGLPDITADDTLNTVTGMAVGMEYHLDGAGYVAYDQATFDALDFSGNHTLDIRIAAEGVNPPSGVVTVTFTTNPIVDASAPEIAAHDDVNAVASSASGAVVNYDVPTATDDVDSVVVVTCLPAFGSTFAIGTTEVACNATDSAGHEAVPTNFNVIVTAPDASGNGTAKTLDTDHNGYVDTIRVMLLPSFVDSTSTDATDYTVHACSGGDATYVVDSVDSADAFTVDLNLVESNSPDTGLACFVDISDATFFGSPVALSLSTVDTAQPVMMSARYQDINTDGIVDLVIVTASEPIDPSSTCVDSDWDTFSGDFEYFQTACMTSPEAFLVSGNDFSIPVNVNDEVRTSSPTSGPNFDYDGTVNIHDVAINDLYNQGIVTIVDDAAPVIVNPLPTSTTEIAKTDSLVVTFSEQMDSEPTDAALRLIANADDTSLVFNTLWSEDGVTVTVTPEETLAADSAYTLFFDPGVSSINGEVGTTFAPTFVNCETPIDPAVIIDQIAGDTSEAGNTATFNVSLATAPTSNVTVDLTSGDLTEGTVSPAELSFNSENWNTPVPVTVTGIDDVEVDGNIGYTINFTVTSEGEYDGLAVTPVALVNDDNDHASNGGGGGGAVSWSIALNAPVGGENYTVGNVIPVSWSTSGSSISTIEISFSKDGGLTYSVIATDEINDSSFSWTAPADAATTHGRIKVSAKSGDTIIVANASSSNDFTILPAPEVLGATTSADSSGTSDGSNLASLADITTGSYIRSTSWSTVYYVDANNVRHPFIDEQDYFTYASSWNEIKWVADETLVQFTMGIVMLPKAPVVLVKILSMPDVYTLELNTEGQTVLRVVPDEATAVTVYGQNWADYVIDISQAFFTDFVMGSAIDSSYHADMSVMKTRAALNGN